MMENKYCRALAELRSKPAHELKEVGDQWRTPDLLFWGINAMFGPLVLDLFADDSNAKCPAWYTAEDNALMQDWSERLAELGGAGFGNPPYSRSQYHDKQAVTGMTHIINHAMAMREKGGRYVFLIKSATSETWWPVRTVAVESAKEYGINHSEFIATMESLDKAKWSNIRGIRAHVRETQESKDKALNESRVWPLEVGLVFNQIEGADALPVSQQNKLKANINQLWLERMPTSEIITTAGGLFNSMQGAVNA